VLVLPVATVFVEEVPMVVVLALLVVLVAAAVVVADDNGSVEDIVFEVVVQVVVGPLTLRSRERNRSRGKCWSGR